MQKQLQTLSNKQWRNKEMDKWEYKYEKIYISELTSFLKDFNKYGKDGWELCAYSESNNIAVFKRKIEE